MSGLKLVSAMLAIGLVASLVEASERPVVLVSGGTGPLARQLDKLNDLTMKKFDPIGMEIGFVEAESACVLRYCTVKAQLHPVEMVDIDVFITRIDLSKVESLSINYGDATAVMKRGATVDNVRYMFLVPVNTARSVGFPDTPMSCSSVISLHGTPGMREKFREPSPHNMGSSRTARVFATAGLFEFEDTPEVVEIINEVIGQCR